MDERVEKWLLDIQMAIDEINSYFENDKRDFFDFKQNTMRKRAIERNLEIIGEAINRILTKCPDIQIKDARKIVNLRNQVIHSYDNVSDENIWAIIINHLPILKEDITFLNYLPIPNREVKPVSADGTAKWESRSPPKYTKDPSSEYGEGFFGVVMKHF